MTGHFFRFRFMAQAAFDASAWLAGLWLATFLRYEMQFGEVDVAGVLTIAGLAAVLQLGLGVLAGLYVHRWRYGTFEEIAATLRVVTAVTVVITLVNLTPVLDRAVPTSAAIVAGFLALSVMCFGRLVWRLLLDRWQRADSEDREPVIIMGAGEGGLQIVTAMLKSGPYHPVAVLDDDPRLKNLRVKGVPVCGSRERLDQVVARTGAKTLIIAIPSASGEAIRDLASRADQLGLHTLILPPVGDLLGSRVGVADIRPLTEADLLGRRELSLDIDSVAGLPDRASACWSRAPAARSAPSCAGRSTASRPESLVMLDRDESALQAVQISIEGRGLLDSRDLVVCCIRDTERLAQVFDEHRPDVVFHAAALKHLPLLEMHPEEGWKTNVWGTAASARAGGEVRRRPLREHLDRQGRGRELGAGPHQACRRAAHVVRRQDPGRHLPERPVRQRPGQPWLGAPAVP